jgi:hypothetical protein
MPISSQLTSEFDRKISAMPHPGGGVVAKKNRKPGATSQACRRSQMVRERESSGNETHVDP